MLREDLGQHQDRLTRFEDLQVDVMLTPWLTADFPLSEVSRPGQTFLSRSSLLSPFGFFRCHLLNMNVLQWRQERVEHGI